MNSNNYCIDSVSRRSSLCPPSHETVLSPPLTPALSQHHPFDKRHSTDLSSYPSNHYHRPSYPVDPWMNQHSIYQQHYPLTQHHHHHQGLMPTQIPTTSSTPSQRSPVLIPSTMTNRVSMSPSGSRKQPTKQNKHACTFPDCSWSFKRFEHLKRHMLVHTGERPHVCPHPGCGKRFSRSDNFHAHYRTHEKKAFARQKQQKQDTTPLAHSPFTTKEEKTTFAHPSCYPHQQSPFGLLHKEHTLINQYQQQSPLQPVPQPSPVQPYSPTPICNKLKIEVVEDESQRKPHPCTHPNCDKRFRRLEHLKRHTRIHTQEQPFECNFPGCSKAFSRSDNLAQHKKTHEKRDSKYGHAQPQHHQLDNFMHHQERYSLVDLIRDNSSPSSSSSNASATDTNKPYHDTKQHSLLNWQQTNESSTESVGC
ncbi:hypothetical protein A0J61_08185 [Choanephora cucurbitarum]|uniref:C2H2-type domain-containing protein n=1 Tax=Choanephora cucurbitarum TaxID=101091 RepID=A0A1C7N3P1_9FUNG|nr:hypothetical protein A0J61_08185 [Choanephora cucurbitarum]